MVGVIPVQRQRIPAFYMVQQMEERVGKGKVTAVFKQVQSETAIVVLPDRDFPLTVIINGDKTSPAVRNRTVKGIIGIFKDSVFLYDETVKP